MMNMEREAPAEPFVQSAQRELRAPDVWVV
jgi:hypothetical protein